MPSDIRLAFEGKTLLSYRAGVALVAGSGVLFSFTALLFRAGRDIDEWQFLFYRGSSAAVTLTLVAFLRRRGRPIRRTALNWQSLVAGMLLAVMACLFILALARTTAATIMFLQAAAPVSGALFGWVLLRERVTASVWACMAAAGVGIAVMIDSGLDTGNRTGLILAAVLPMALGLYNVLIRSAPDADPLVPALVGSLGLACTAGLVAATGPGLNPGVADIALGVVAGGLLLGLGLPLLNLGHASVPSAQVSLLLMTEVILAPLWVWIWPGETPSGGTIIGGLIVLAAVVALVLVEGSASRRGSGGRRRVRGVRRVHGGGVSEPVSAVSSSRALSSPASFPASSPGGQAADSAGL